MYSLDIMDIIQAESWPWEEKALKELNDDPQLRSEKLQQFKQMITQFQKENPKFNPPNEDALYMAFLRTRKFDVSKAFRCLKRYYEIRLCKPDIILPKGKGPRDYPHVFDGPIAVLLRRRNPLDGSLVVIWTFRNYDPNIGEISDVFNITFLLANEMMADPSAQTFGTRLILDFTGMRLMYSTMVLTRMYYLKAIVSAQEAFPARFCGFHVINDPFGLAKALYRVFRPMLSAKMRSRIHFHGSDLTELHRFVSPKILPEEFNGEAGPMNSQWLKEVMYERHDDIVRKSHFGFV